MKDINLVCFITNLCITVLCGGLMLLIPKLTRKSYLFGVKIPAEETSSPEAKALKKNYTTVCLLGMTVMFAIIILQFIVFPDISLISVMYFPLLFVAVQMSAFVPNWKRAVKLKEERGWKVSGSAFADTKSSYTRGNLSELPWGWYIAGLVFILASILITLVKYPSLPDIIPTHFGADMQPDVWSNKSLLTVLTMPLINLATLLIFWLTGIMIVRAKLQIDPQNPALSFAQHRIYRRRAGHSMGFLALGLALTLGLLGLITAFPDINIPSWLMIPFMIIIIILIIPAAVVPISSGQGGCKIKPKEVIDRDSGKTLSSSVQNTYGRGDDKYWALGMFYHNSEDPAYIVEDRFGGNLGFNYARLPVKIGVTAAALAFIAMYVWITVLMCSGILN